MRICIDVRSIKNIPTGLGKYAYQLVKGLAEIDQVNEYVLLQRTMIAKPVIEQPNFTSIYFPTDIDSFKSITQVAKLINEQKVDLYHSLYNFLPEGLDPKIKAIVTYHDFSWILSPVIAQRNLLRGMIVNIFARIVYPRTMKRARHVICISKNTQADLHRLYPYPSTQSSVIYHGVDLNQRKQGEIRKEIVAWQNRQYILQLGNTRAYKNPIGTLKGLEKIKEEYPNCQLIYVGRGDGILKVMEYAKRYDLADRIHHLQQLSDAEVYFLLQHAQLLSFPSLYEGFGLPVVEAYQAGCPVLCSNISALKEIGEFASCQIDPHSSDSIAAGMRRILSDPVYRQSLIEQGKKMADQFRWSRAASETFSVYQRVYHEE